MVRLWTIYHSVIPGNYICYVCGQEKSHHHYYTHRTRWNGVCSRCIVCDRDYSRKQREARKQSISYQEAL